MLNLLFTGLLICHGDSITFQGVFTDNQSYCQQIQNRHTDWRTVNAGIPGESTTLGLLRIKYLIEANRQYYLTSNIYVSILEGINDALTVREGCDYPPKKTAKNLFRMAKIVKRNGGIPILMTLTPAKGSRGCEFTNDLYVEEVNYYLKFYALKYPRITLYDLNEQFNGTDFYTMFPDGVHPSTAARTLIADFIDSLIW